jgi:xylulose-5-phosphate/fructose-6-phosphate phosphoketolase
MEHCISEIRKHQDAARKNQNPERPRWPMIVLRSPKGWTAPKEVGGHRLEGFWRSHQVPMADVKTNAKRLHELEVWMRSYKPEELFDSKGTLIAELKELAPTGDRRMGANPHANGGQLKKALHLPDFRDYAFKIDAPGTVEAENTRPLGAFLRDVMKLNPKNFRVFGPDETTSNRLSDIYEVSKKLWLENYFPEDSDGGELAPDGRVLEMLSENTIEGMLEGYLLTGRHGFISSYEAFIHVIDSMFNQHAKWLTISNHLPWRAKIPSLNILVTSTVWRQDHNGFTHQDPGFLDVVLNKSADVVRIYLPPDINTLLSTADHCLRSENYVNVIVCDKQKHLQYLSMDAAITHCTKGIGRWEPACNDQGAEPDVVFASAGDVPTQEALAAIIMLREEFPDLKIRYVNVVDLLRLQPETDHPHGLSDRNFDLLFTVDKPIIFNFHGYPWLIHRLTYSRKNHPNLHVHGYKEHGNINTPLELAIENEIDRFTLAMDAIKYVPRLQRIGSAALEKFRNEQIACRNYAFEHGTDRPDVAGWRWPQEKTRKAA